MFVFEKYKVNDLYLASISVLYPDNAMWDTDIGGMLMTGLAGYGYSTILKKDGEKYIDLQNKSIKITTTRNPKETSYTIDYIVPLNEYYTQDGKEKDTLSRKEAINIAKQYYNEIYANRLNKSQTDSEKVKRMQKNNIS